MRWSSEEAEALARRRLAALPAWVESHLLVEWAAASPSETKALLVEAFGSLGFGDRAALSAELSRRAQSSSSATGGSDHSDRLRQEDLDARREAARAQGESARAQARANELAETNVRMQRASLSMATRQAEEQTYQNNLAAGLVEAGVGLASVPSSFLVEAPIYLARGGGEMAAGLRRLALDGKAIQVRLPGAGRTRLGQIFDAIGSELSDRTTLDGMYSLGFRLRLSKHLLYGVATFNYKLLGESASSLSDSDFAADEAFEEDFAAMAAYYLVEGTESIRAKPAWRSNVLNAVCIPAKGNAKGAATYLPRMASSCNDLRTRLATAAPGRAKESAKETKFVKRVRQWKLLSDYLFGCEEAVLMPAYVTAKAFAAMGQRRMAVLTAEVEGGELHPGLLAEVPGMTPRQGIAHWGKMLVKFGLLVRQSVEDCVQAVEKVQGNTDLEGLDFVEKCMQESDLARAGSHRAILAEAAVLAFDLDDPRGHWQVVALPAMRANLAIANTTAMMDEAWLGGVAQPAPAVGLDWAARTMAEFAGPAVGGAAVRETPAILRAGILSAPARKRYGRARVLFDLGLPAAAGAQAGQVGRCLADACHLGCRLTPGECGLPHDVQRDLGAVSVAELQLALEYSGLREFPRLRDEREMRCVLGALRLVLDASRSGRRDADDVVLALGAAAAQLGEAAIGRAYHAGVRAAAHSFESFFALLADAAGGAAQPVRFFVERLEVAGLGSARSLSSAEELSTFVTNSSEHFAFGAGLLQRRGDAWAWVSAAGDAAPAGFECAQLALRRDGDAAGELLVGVSADFVWAVAQLEAHGLACCSDSRGASAGIGGPCGGGAIRVTAGGEAAARAAAREGGRPWRSEHDSRGVIDLGSLAEQPVLVREPRSLAAPYDADAGVSAPEDGAEVVQAAVDAPCSQGGEVSSMDECARGDGGVSTLRLVRGRKNPPSSELPHRADASVVPQSGVVAQSTPPAAPAAVKAPAPGTKQRQQQVGGGASVETAPALCFRRSDGTCLFSTSPQPPGVVDSAASRAAYASLEAAAPARGVPPPCESALWATGVTRTVPHRDTSNVDLSTGMAFGLDAADSGELRLGCDKECGGGESLNIDWKRSPVRFDSASLMHGGWSAAGNPRNFTWMPKDKAGVQQRQRLPAAPLVGAAYLAAGRYLDTHLPGLFEGPGWLQQEQTDAPRQPLDVRVRKVFYKLNPVTQEAENIEPKKLLSAHDIFLVRLVARFRMSTDATRVYSLLGCLQRRRTVAGSPRQAAGSSRKVVSAGAKSGHRPGGAGAAVGGSALRGGAGVFTPSASSAAGSGATKKGVPKGVSFDAARSVASVAPKASEVLIVGQPTEAGAPDVPATFVADVLGDARLPEQPLVDVLGAAPSPGQFVPEFAPAVLTGPVLVGASASSGMPRGSPLEPAVPQPLPEVVARRARRVALKRLVDACGVFESLPCSTELASLLRARVELKFVRGEVSGEVTAPVLRALLAAELPDVARRGMMAGDAAALMESLGTASEPAALGGAEGGLRLTWADGELSGLDVCGHVFRAADHGEDLETALGEVWKLQCLVVLVAVLTDSKGADVHHDFVVHALECARELGFEEALPAAMSAAVASLRNSCHDTTHKDHRRFHTVLAHFAIDRLRQFEFVFFQPPTSGTGLGQLVIYTGRDFIAERLKSLSAELSPDGRGGQLAPLRRFGVFLRGHAYSAVPVALETYGAGFPRLAACYPPDALCSAVMAGWRATAEAAEGDDLCPTGSFTACPGCGEKHIRPPVSRGLLGGAAASLRWGVGKVAGTLRALAKLRGAAVGEVPASSALGLGELSDSGSDSGSGSGGESDDDGDDGASLERALHAAEEELLLTRPDLHEVVLSHRESRRGYDRLAACRLLVGYNMTLRREALDAPGAVQVALAELNDGALRQELSLREQEELAAAASLASLRGDAVEAPASVDAALGGASVRAPRRKRASGRRARLRRLEVVPERSSEAVADIVSGALFDPRQACGAAKACVLPAAALALLMALGVAAACALGGPSVPRFAPPLTMEEPKSAEGWHGGNGTAAFEWETGGIGGGGGVKDARWHAQQLCDFYNGNCEKSYDDALFAQAGRLGDGLLGASDTFVGAMAMYRDVWNDNFGNHLCPKRLEEMEGLPPELQKFCTNLAREGANSTTETPGVRRRGKPGPSVAEHMDQVKSGMWTDMINGRILVCTSAMEAKLGNLSAHDLHRIPKKLAGVVIVDDGRLISDMRPQNEGMHKSKFPLCRLPTFASLARRSILLGYNYPGVEQRIAKRDVKAAFKLIWLRPQDMEQYVTEMPGKYVGDENVDYHVCYLCLTFGSSASPGLYHSMSLAMHYYHNARGPANPDWNGTHAFWSVTLVDDGIIIDVDMGDRLELSGECYDEGTVRVLGPFAQNWKKWAAEGEFVPESLVWGLDVKVGDMHNDVKSGSLDMPEVKVEAQRAAFGAAEFRNGNKWVKVESVRVALGNLIYLTRVTPSLLTEVPGLSAALRGLGTESDQTYVEFGGDARAVQLQWDDFWESMELICVVLDTPGACSLPFHSPLAGAFTAAERLSITPLAARTFLGGDADMHGIGVGDLTNKLYDFFATEPFKVLLAAFASNPEDEVIIFLWELFTVVAAATKWGALWSATLVINVTDNDNTRIAINKGRSDNRVANWLLRVLAALKAHYKFDMVSVWIWTHHNILFDTLSRAFDTVSKMGISEAQVSEYMAESHPEMRRDEVTSVVRRYLEPGWLGRTFAVPGLEAQTKVARAHAQARIDRVFEESAAEVAMARSTVAVAAAGPERVVDFFSGSGAFGVAFQNLGVEVLGRCECDDKIDWIYSQCVSARFRSVDLYSEDYAHWASWDPALICASPSCQPWSRANPQAAGFGDERGRGWHVYDVLRLVRRFRRTFVCGVMEEVNGLGELDGGFAIEHLRRSLALENITLSVEEAVAVHHGTPQARRRLILAFEIKDVARRIGELEPLKWAAEPAKALRHWLDPERLVPDTCWVDVPGMELDYDVVDEERGQFAPRKVATLRLPGGTAPYVGASVTLSGATGRWRVLRHLPAGEWYLFQSGAPHKLTARADRLTVQAANHAVYSTDGYAAPVKAWGEPPQGPGTVLYLTTRAGQPAVRCLSCHETWRQQGKLEDCLTRWRDAWRAGEEGVPPYNPSAVYSVGGLSIPQGLADAAAERAVARLARYRAAVAAEAPPHTRAPASARAPL